MNKVRTFNIRMTGGAVMTIDASQQLLNNIVVAFKLSGVDDVNESHVTKYLMSSISSTLEKVDEKNRT